MILKVIHLADTDGVFIDEKYVKEADVAHIQYFEDHMETKHVEAIIDRNQRKAKILFKLRKTGKISESIPYRLYFNSCNLEHVLYNELQDFTDEEKQEMSDDFAEKYEGKLDEFIKFISDPLLAVPGTYQNTWNYIEEGLNSLHRYSNMHLIFESKK